MRFLVLALAVALLAGCGSSEVRTMPNSARTSAPPVPPYLQNNPNVPASVKKAVAGAIATPPNGSPSAGK